MAICCRDENRFFVFVIIDARETVCCMMVFVLLQLRYDISEGELLIWLVSLLVMESLEIGFVDLAESLERLDYHPIIKGL